MITLSVYYMNLEMKLSEIFLQKMVAYANWITLFAVNVKKETFSEKS